MVTCPRCRLPIAPVAIGDNGATECTVCHERMEVTLFPAAVRPQEKGMQPEKVLTAGEATCYLHQDHIAVAACEACGAYVCALCDIPIAGKHYCGTCFTARRHSGVLVHETVLHDQGALGGSFIYLFMSCFISIMPFKTLVFFIIPMVLVGAVVCAFCVWNWNKVHTPYPRSHARFVAAIVFAAIGILALVASLTTRWALGLTTL